MPSQKLPLFDGIIQPVHCGVVPNPTNNLIFAKSFDPKAPRTYEVHLWLMPQEASALYSVVASEGPYATAVKKAEVWTGRATGAPNDSFPNGSRPIKVLDGYPVRGDVQLSLNCTAAADSFPTGPQMFGYYYQVGSGEARDFEHRYIGDKTLSGFNQGVPQAFVVPATGGGISADLIIHTFEPGRIDDISLALSMLGAGESDIYVASIRFEDVNNVSLIPGHSVIVPMTDVVSNPTYEAGTAGQPGINTPASSPYILQGIPLGGNPRLHHIRVAFAAIFGGPGVASVHGFFIRH